MPRRRTPIAPTRDRHGVHQSHASRHYRRGSQHDLLKDLRRSLPTALALDAVFQETARGAAMLLRAQAASLWRVDEAAGQLQAGAFWSTTPTAAAPPQTICLEQDATGWVARQQQRLNVPDLGRDARFVAFEYWQQRGWCRFLGVPILLEEKLFAVLACHATEPCVLDRASQELLDTFLTCVCITLHHAILYATATTARRAAEQSAYVQASLAVRQASLYATETRARNALEAAMRAKNTFLANMSHELRTPLNAVINYRELLQEEMEEQGHVAYVADLRKIHEAGRQLLALITDVLDFARIEAGKVELTRDTFAVPALVYALAELLQPLLAQHANTLESHIADEVQWLYGDRLKVQQSLLHLLHNACKFTSHGHITLDVAHETVQDAIYIRFQVRDAGIGMGPEQLATLFQPFTRGDDTTTRKYGGTGLGLVISQRLCQLMGGEITVTSTLGQGSTFTMRLPAPSHMPVIPQCKGRVCLNVICSW